MLNGEITHGPLFYRSKIYLSLERSTFFLNINILCAMDIHRCRFVPFPSSTINVLAFSHSQGSRENKATDLRLAIGRANGNIEIWNPLNGAWLQETILRGGKDRSIDGLAWIQDPEENDACGKVIVGKLRLFSTGYTTTVTEWDLEKGQPLRQSSGNHGEIWCLAAQLPVSLGQKHSTGYSSSEQWLGQNLLTGCTDGAVVLYSTADQDLQLQRILVRPSSKKAKVISLVFQDRNIAVAGCTDSTIRIYDIRTGTLVRSMSLGAGPTGGPKETIVWAVKCLPNGNILSGDSTGEMRLWDGKTYSLIQRLKCHKQDILSLATSVDGSMIFSGGMDRRTVVYKQTGGGRSRWGEVTHRRFHSHDVKTMATFEGNGMSIVASGGIVTTSDVGSITDNCRTRWKSDCGTLTRIWNGIPANATMSSTRARCAKCPKEATLDELVGP
jgi:U3 small nucleolar RNA-associated protein 4